VASGKMELHLERKGMLESSYVSNIDNSSSIGSKEF
jgi:hypothetical protein